MPDGNYHKNHPLRRAANHRHGEYINVSSFVALSRLRLEYTALQSLHLSCDSAACQSHVSATAAGVGLVG